MSISRQTVCTERSCVPTVVAHEAEAVKPANTGFWIRAFVEFGGNRASPVKSGLRSNIRYVKARAVTTMGTNIASVPFARIVSVIGFKLRLVHPYHTFDRSVCDAVAVF